jgi:hypothetical protein
MREAAVVHRRYVPAAGPMRQSCASRRPGLAFLSGFERYKPIAARQGKHLLDGYLWLAEPAGAEGLEPPAYGFGDRRSTN